MDKNQQVAIKSAMALALPVDEIKTIRDANIIVNTVMSISGRVNLAACKAFQIVRDNKLYKNEYKTFDLWAKKNFNISKATAYTYAKVGEMLNDNATQSTLPHAKNVEWSFSALVLLTQKLTKERICELIDDGKIASTDSINDLKKVLKRVTKGEELDSEIIEEKTEILTKKAEKAEKAEPINAKLFAKILTANIVDYCNENGIKDGEKIAENAVKIYNHYYV